VKRDKRNGVGLTRGRRPITISAINLSGAGSDAETRDRRNPRVAMKKPGTLSTAEMTRNGVRPDVDHAGPGFRDTNVAECREGFGDAGTRPLDDEAVRHGVKHPYMLERRRRIESQCQRRLPFIDKTTAKAKNAISSSEMRVAGR